MPNAAHSHELNPQDYYMSRINEFDDTVWDIEVQVETGYPAGTAVLKRRAKWITIFGTPELDSDDPSYVEEESVSGYQMVQASPDTIAVYLGEFDHTMQAIYQQWVHAEKWNDVHKYWERPQPISKQSEVLYDENGRVLGVEYTADFGGGNYLKTIIDYNWFTGRVNKHTYEFYWPGETKRVYTQLQIYNQSRFHMDISDFDGPYEVIEQAGLTNVIYYPDGVADDLCRVDPYLGVDEPGNYIVVTCDGFKIRVDHSSSTISSIKDINDITLCDFIESYIRPTDIYRTRLDTNKAAAIIESNSNRVIIRLIGNFYNTTLGYMPGSLYIEHMLYIYNDKIFIDVTWVTTSLITITTLSVLEYISSGSLTAEQTVYESGNAEVIGTGNIDTADYGGYRANELNIVSTDLYRNIIGVSPYKNLIATYLETRIGSGDVQVGTHKYQYVIFLDSVNRQNDSGTWKAWATATSYAENEIVLESNLRYICKVAHTSGVFATDLAAGYWLEYRIELGNQYKDQLIPTLVTGSKVTDLIIPSMINDMSSDGGFPFEQANKEIEHNWDIDRIKPVEVIYDPPFQTGSPNTPIEYLVEYFEFNDNAVNNIIVAEVGNNAAWKNITDGSNRNTNLDSIVDGSVRGRALNTGAGLAYAELNQGNYPVSFLNKGSILINLTPQWPAGTSPLAYQTLFEIYCDDNNYVWALYVPQNELIICYFVWNNMNVNVQISGLGVSFPNDPNAYQVAHPCLFSWDSDRGVVSAFIAGISGEMKYHTAEPNQIDTPEIRIGCRSLRTDPGQYLLHSFKTFNDCILPYGAGSWKGNGEINSNTHHSDIQAFVKGDEDNTNSLKIGTGTLTISGVTKVPDQTGE